MPVLFGDHPAGEAGIKRGNYNEEGGAERNVSAGEHG